MATIFARRFSYCRVLFSLVTGTQPGIPRPDPGDEADSPTTYGYRPRPSARERTSRPAPVGYGYRCFPPIPESAAAGRSPLLPIRPAARPRRPPIRASAPVPSVVRAGPSGDVPARIGCSERGHLRLPASCHFCRSGYAGSVPAIRARHAAQPGADTDLDEAPRALVIRHRLRTRTSPRTPSSARCHYSNRRGR